MATAQTQQTTGTTLQAYEQKIAEHIHDANVRIDEFEAKSRVRRAQAEVRAIDGLKVARHTVERMLANLKTTREAQVARAKADIDAAIVTLQASLDDFRRRFTSPSDRK